MKCYSWKSFLNFLQSPTLYVNKFNKLGFKEDLLSHQERISSLIIKSHKTVRKNNFLFSATNSKIFKRKTIKTKNSTPL